MHPDLNASFEKVLERGLKRLAPHLRPVMVVSHERSGTHFTMNALAACFGYASRPWLDVDETNFNINYYYPRMFAHLIYSIGQLRTASIAKSHHEAAFFGEFLNQVRNIEIVYVYRHPADVMVSLWRFLPTWPWIEGPDAANPVELARTEPRGRIMRYQYQQYPDMLDRWANHVSGWIAAAAQFRQVHLVRYEDLAHDYEQTITALGAALHAAPVRMVRPPAHDNVVGAGPVAFEGVARAQDRELLALTATRRYPDLMHRLGYAEAEGRRLRQGQG